MLLFQGEKLYTVTGNNQYMVRQLHTPLTLRKEYFQLQLDELKKQHEQSSTKVTGENKSQTISHGVDTGIPVPA
jgi:hypothetical protein